MSIAISSVETIVVDLPLRRLQQFSALDTVKQSYLIIRIKTNADIEGFGEAVTPGGPWWGGESIEAMKVTIDTYLAPLLLGEDPLRLSFIMDKMNKTVANNHSAKAGLEMGLLDIAGKVLEQPLHVLLGGKMRDSLPVSWPLAMGDADKDIAEAEEKLATRRHAAFKVKMGALPLEADIARAVAIGRALASRASVRVDPNQVWDEATARRWIPVLEDAGIEIVEQPVAHWNLGAMARLTQSSRASIMADESLASCQDMLAIAENQAASIVSLKVMKSGGINASRLIARIAEARGIAVYMGTFLETSLGTAANMQLAASLSKLPWGGELIGPQLLAEDICEQPADYHDCELWLNEGVGIAARIDPDRLKAFRRDRQYSIHPVAEKIA